MANFKYTADLLNYILFMAGEPTDGTSDFEANALEQLNRSYQAIWSGGSEIDPSVREVWWWLRKEDPGTLLLEPPIETGTLTVTKGDTAVVFSSAPASSVADWHIRINNDAEVYRVASHTAASANAVLDGAYVTTSGSYSYKLMKLEYDLATDVYTIASPMRIYTDSRDEITGMELPSLEERWPLRLVQQGTPEAFAVVRDRISDTSPIRVRFSHFGDEAVGDYIRVDYDYYRVPDDLVDSGSQEPLVPLHMRRMIADHALSFLFLGKNDNKATSFATLAKNGLIAMAREQRQRRARFSKDYGRIMTRQKSLVRGPLRTESGHIIG